MNREIKFRGKRYNGDWVYGDLCKKPNRFTSIVYYGTYGECCEHSVDYETICQFTGRTDKNGQKIYESDIVRVPSLDSFGLTEVDVMTNAVVSFYMGSFIVEYNRGKYIIELRCLKDDEIEVIGNIHDNKELLEV